MRATVSRLGLYNYNSSIFDGMALPSAFDRTGVIDYIFMECAELELLYPEFDIMKELINRWSRARLHSWERLYQSTVQKYNMIHNYDRYEDWTDNGNASSKGDASQSKAAYNSNSMARTDATTTTGTTTNASTHHGHLYGNIGVVTAATMLTEERKLATYDVYAAIAQEFKERFCNLIY